MSQFFTVNFMISIVITLFAIIVIAKKKTAKKCRLTFLESHVRNNFVLLSTNDFCKFQMNPEMCEFFRRNTMIFSVCCPTR